MLTGKRWTEIDRLGNEIYLTEERWDHIIDATNHPEMEDCEGELRETIHVGLRQQDTLNPKKYRYSKAFDNLPEDNTHVVAIVLFGSRQDENGNVLPNNYITTAYLKEIG